MAGFFINQRLKQIQIFKEWVYFLTHEILTLRHKCQKTKQYCKFFCFTVPVTPYFYYRKY
jgi:hypothetical protein